MKIRKILVLVANNFINDTRVLKESYSLSNTGYKVTVLAVNYSNLPEHELISGFELQRLSLKTPKFINYKFGETNSLQKFIIYTEMICRYIYTLRKSFRDCDILHCNDIQTLPFGAIFKCFINKNAKILYDCHEHETEKYMNNGIQKFIAKIIEWIYIRFADEISTVSESIANDYAKMYKIPPPKLILNCPYKYEPKKSNLFREKFNLSENQKIFLYQGVFLPERGIEFLLEAFKKMESYENVIVFLGNGPLQNKIEEFSDLKNNIFFCTSVPPDQVLKYTSSADFGFSFLQDVNLNHRYALPNKFFEYIQSGIPVLVSNRKEIRNIVSEYNLGEVIEEDTVDSIIKAVNKISAKDKDFFKSNLKIAADKFNWEEQEKVLLSIYKNLK